MEEIVFRPLTEVAGLLRRREVSSVELTETLLKRIARVDVTFHSYATVMEDRALEAARRADGEIGAGRYRGPLHGAPIAVKDLCFTKGVRTMGGTAALAGHVPDFDATVVERLEAAGAVILGKLNLTEGAMGGYHPSFPIPLNPWNRGVWTGGSSSGSGVATAAGLAYATLGSDTGGSIRFPSAACGVVGLKPTWGRVSRHGVLALAESLDHVGPMTRRVADAAVVLQAIAGRDGNDPTSLLDPVPDFSADLGRGVKGVRLGVDEDYLRRKADPELAEAVLAGVRDLEGLGAEVVTVRLPDFDDYVPAWQTLCTAEAVAAHAATYPSRRDDYGPWFRDWLDLGARVSGADYARAHYARAACNGRLRAVMAGIDLLVCPSMTAPPHPVTPEGLYGPMVKRDVSFQRFTVPFDFNGAPTLSVPCGFTRGGLPLSIQFVGHPLREDLICRVGHAYEQATEWHKLRPNV
jgi:amidase